MSWRKGIRLTLRSPARANGDVRDESNRRGRFPLSVTRDRIVDAGDGPGRSFALFFIRLSHAPWNVTRSAKGISRGIFKNYRRVRPLPPYLARRCRPLKTTIGRVGQSNFFGLSLYASRRKNLKSDRTDFRNWSPRCLVSSR